MVDDQGQTVAVGRPSLYTEERVARILWALQHGGSYSLAARYAGISVSTLHAWRRDSRERGEESHYYPFHTMCDENVAIGAMRALEAIEVAAMQGDWKAAAWRLTHNPFTRSEYADKVELTGAGDSPLISIDALRGLLPKDGPGRADTDDDFEGENVVRFHAR